MTEQKLNTDYNDFAWFYNSYWSDRLIDQIFWTIDKYLLNNLRPGSSILDVCCGNGHLAARMTQKGFSVTGIDASAEMLRYARINSPESSFHLQDVRELELNAKFDAAVSTCDSLNHVMTLEDLSEAFANIYRALKPGGQFLFDLNTEEGYHKYWNSQTGGRSEKDNAFIIKLSYDDKSKQAVFEATMFRLINDLWLRSEARLTQQYYPKDDVINSLNRTGFSNIDFYDVEKDLGIDGTGRMMFVTRKSP